MLSRDEILQRRARLSAEKQALLEKRLRGKSDAEAQASSIPRRAEAGPAPLSFAQQRLWFLDQLAPGNPFYNIPLAVRLGGELDIAAFRHSLNAIVARHETLRTTFLAAAGQPTQVIAPRLVLGMPLVDLHTLPGAERELVVERLFQQEAQSPFDLAHGPLIRATLLRLDTDAHLLFLTIHHIVADGWSLGVLLRELVPLYESFKAGRPVRLPQLAIQYADYAIWQRQWLENTVLETQLAYWKRQLAGLAPLELPTDHLRRAVETYHGAEVRFALSQGQTKALNELSRQEGVTLFMTLLAAFKLLLYRYTGQVDMVVGSAIANRNRSELEYLIGFFVNTLVLRTDLSGQPTFREIMRRVCDVTLGAYAHQDVPFEKLVGALQPERDLSRTPLFQVMFTLMNVPFPDLEIDGLVLSRMDIDTGVTQFDLSVEVRETLQGLVVGIKYGADLFDTTTISRMAQHFQCVLQSAVATPDARLSDLSFLTEDERYELLVGWNATEVAYPQNVSIAQLFEAQVGRTPDAVAVIYDERFLTFRELESRANHLARYLHRLGVGPEVCVGVCMERSPDLIVGLLGVVKAGGAYVPLDPSYPPARLQAMLDDAGVAVLLTATTERNGERDIGRRGDRETAEARALLCSASPLLHFSPSVDLVADWPAISQASTANLAHAVTADHLAYMIYTSGSTGEPKGVAVPHRGLLNLVYWHLRTYDLSAADRVTHLAGVGFDASVWELWPALVAGASLALPDDHTRVVPDRLRDWLVDQAITICFLPTPLAEVVLALEWPRETALRCLLTGGDRLRRYPMPSLPFTLVNHYGPTEYSVVTTAAIVPAQPQPHAPPIGRPIANTQVYILDKYLHPVPTGIAGELYIGGAGLARGYLNQPNLTAERFVPNPFGEGLGVGGWGLGERSDTKIGDEKATQSSVLSPQSSSRLYRTGDLARYRPDGAIEYLGRLDHQVKIRGFRIELGEIEVVLSQHPAIREGVVLVREDTPGVKRLVAYVGLRTEAKGLSEAPTQSSVLSPQSSLIAALRAFLAERLPDYMVPASFVVLDNLPLTHSGKVNRQALPAPECSTPAAEERFAAPRTPAEATLVAIWSAVLGRPHIGIHDNFFALGGDSILSIQIIARAHAAGLRLTPRHLFQHQTIAQLAQVASSAPQPQATQVPVCGPVPLTLIQHWFFAQDLPDPQHFNQALLLQAHQRLDMALLARALHELVQHHHALRLRFTLAAGVWQQRITAAEPARLLSVIDLAGLPAADQAGAISVVAAGMQLTLNLAQGPLLRAVVMERGPAQPQHLLLIIHHLAVDEVSWRILLEDVQTAYGRLSRGEAVMLPSQTTAFKQWAEELSAYAQSDALLQERDYWLAPARRAVERLPLDNIGANTVASARSVSMVLDAQATHALLHEVPPVYHTQISDVLLTALVQSMASWTGIPRLLVDLEAHGREDMFAEVDLTRTVGWFTTLYPVTLELEPAAGPGAALKAIKEQLRAVPQHGIGYGVLRYLRAEEPEGAALRAQPTAEVIFNALGRLDQSLASAELFEIAAEASGPPQSPRGLRSHVLAIHSSVVDDHLKVEWEYSAQLHQRATITRLAEHFMQTLRALIRHCQEPTAGGYTPSDFPAAHVSQQELDALIARVTHAGEFAAEQIEDIYALSPLQQGMLFHSLYTPTADAYFQQVGYAIGTRLNVVAFERAWQAVLERHPVLHSSFHWDGLRAPLQVVHRQAHLPIERYDWRALDPAEQQRQLENFLAADRQRGFDLTCAPALRLTLFQLAEQHSYLVWSHHHILLDGWSAALVLKEVLALYEAFAEQRTIDLGQRYPYRVYIDWLQRQQVSAAEAFWRERLKGFSAPTPLPLSQPRTLDRSTSRAEEYLRLPAATSSALLALARQQQITLSTVVQGVWALLLSHYSGEEDILFGVTSSGRPPALAGVELIVGLLINTLPARVRIAAAESAVTWFQQLQAQQIAMQQYEHSSLVQIQGWSDMPRGTPLFESLVIFENYPIDASMHAQNLHLPITSAHVFGHTNYPLTLVAFMDDASLTLRLGYERRRFDADAITRLLGHMGLLLESFIASPHQQLSALPTLTADERYQVLTLWNATQAIYPTEQALCLHQLFEAQVARTPDAVAVVGLAGGRWRIDPNSTFQAAIPNAQLTYAELDRRANQLARALRRLGVRSETRAGIRMERSLDLLVGVLGILKAGGTYLPLDSTHPTKREAFILADARAAVLLTEQIGPEERGQLAGKPPADTSQRPAEISLHELPAALAHESMLPLDSPVAPDNLAYVIYTSGSTGQPKGVQITHRAVVNFLCAMRDQPGLSQNDVLLAVTTLAFDIAALELFLPLTTGARLVLADYATATDGVRLAQALDTAAATVMQATPATWRMLVESGWQGRSGLRILCGGERLPRQLADQLLSRAAQVWNLYGPTETTIWSSISQVQHAEDTIPIGRPIANTLIYLLDRYLRLVPIGVAGELYIGGAGVARGYLDRPDLTAERFVPNPFATGDWVLGTGDWETWGHGDTEIGDETPTQSSVLSPQSWSRLYRTGDLARFRVDGAIEFLGRADQQVKLRGFRIELGEIEAALARHPAVRAAVVVARTGRSGDTRLAAYVVPNSGFRIQNSEAGSEKPEILHSAFCILHSDELRAFLKTSLPDYMIPASFVTLDALPLTPNGKIDRRALPDTEGQRPELSASYLPPQPGLERNIARIWQAVLEVDRVGRHDNFFDLGGHSLLMVQVQSELCNLIDQPISMIELFSYPTISMLAEHLRRAAVTTLSLETPEQVEQRSETVRQRRELRKQSRRIETRQEDSDA